MTSVCTNNGPSGPDGNHDNFLVFSAYALGSYLNNKGAFAAYVLAPLIGTLTFDLSTFCAGEPPPMVNYTPADIASWFLPTNLHGLVDLRTAMYNVVGNLLWYDACKCLDNVTPAGPLPPADPGGFAFNDPTLPTTTATVPCLNTARVNLVPTQQTWTLTDLTFGLTMPLVTGGQFNWFWEPSGLGNPSACTMELNLYGSHSQVLGTVPQWRALASDSGTVRFAVPLGLARVDLVVTADAFPNPNRVSFELALFCNNDQPGGTVQPCCPPDASVQEMMASIQQLVSLVQRQTAAFGYVPGVTYAGLSGNGEVALSDVWGVRIIPQVIPPSAGVEVGDPDTLWLDSWINWGSADGWLPREFLRSSPHISNPRNAGVYTKLGYSLRPGLTVDIQTLLREP